MTLWTFLSTCIASEGWGNRPGLDLLENFTWVSDGHAGGSIVLSIIITTIIRDITSATCPSPHFAWQGASTLLPTALSIAYQTVS